MIIAVVRAIILYIIVLISMRVMGKGELGEMQPFDMVITLIIAELAAMPMEDLDSPLVHGIVAIITLMSLQVFISYITLKSDRVRGFFCGRPSIVFQHGKFNSKEMKKLRININDIIEQTRLKGFENLKDVDYIIMEPNGDISVIGIQKVPLERCNRIPITVIMDGKITHENIKKFNISLESIKSELVIRKLKLKNIIYGFLDENNEFNFHERQ